MRIIHKHNSMSQCLRAYINHVTLMILIFMGAFMPHLKVHANFLCNISYVAIQAHFATRQT